MVNRAWVFDSSVVLRAALGDSEAAKSWIESAKARGDRMILSRFGELEIQRTLLRKGRSPNTANEILDEFVFVTVNDSLLRLAASIPFSLSGADSVHIATALRLGNHVVGVVTHDREMAEAAKYLGFTVVDPVTDDPRGPVA